jgi:predicted P-loop ATPase
MLKTAENYYSSGLHVIPVVEGAKHPKLKSWNPKERIKESELFEHFISKSSIGLVCGYASGGVEAIDFDNHFGDAETVLSEFGAIEGVSELLNSCVLESTPSGGYHLVYKCKKIGNNKKLARRLNDKKKPEALIETRGDGGYIVCAPSQGYELIQGDFNNIPTITVDERDLLLTAAMALNEYHVEITEADPIRGDGQGERPGDIFNNSPEAAQKALDCLLSHGWKQGTNKKHLVRPNKNIKNGISATFGQVAPGVLNVFSSNAHPFEIPSDKTSAGFGPYRILGLLQFNGDFKACSKELYSQGYKSKDKKKLSKSQKTQIDKTVKTKLKDGRLMSPMEMNEVAKKLDIPVTEVKSYVQESQASQKELEDYENWPEVAKVEYYLAKKYEFRIDIVRRIAEMRNVGQGDWVDLNEHEVFRHLQHDEPKIKYSLQGIKSLLKSDFVSRYDPFIEYFEKIEKWDGVDHIAKLCAFLKTDDDEYFVEMLKKALVRTIKCALEPDYYNRIVLVFSSEAEEIGKSRFFMWLNPFKHLYYSDEILRDNKDSRLALCENFIYNLEELDGLNRHGSAKLKATISTRGVTDRLPYAESKSYFPRRCSFFGSTNHTEFLLNDKNTRWLPFKIESIDWKGYIKACDTQKIWQQVYALFIDESFEYELSDTEKSTRNERNEEYRIEDIEEGMIKKYFEMSHDRFMSSSEILKAVQEVSGGIKISWNSVQLGKTLTRLGFLRKRQGSQRGWGIDFDATGVIEKK